MSDRHGWNFFRPASHPTQEKTLHVPGDIEAHRTGPVMPRHSGSSHYLIQFSAQPSPEHIRKMLDRGVRINSHVPGTALVVSGADDVSWNGLDLNFVGRLGELDKLRAELSAEQTASDSTESLAIAEFHNDVDMSDARAGTGAERPGDRA